MQVLGQELTGGYYFLFIEESPPSSSYSSSSSSSSPLSYANKNRSYSLQPDIGLFSILGILCFCFVLCIVSPFVYSSFFHIYRPQPLGGKQFAVNKYHISYLISSE
jgi:hypothetical protein